MRSSRNVPRVLLILAGSTWGLWYLGMGLVGWGEPGRSGRTPDAFKKRMHELVSSEERIRHLETVLEDSTHLQFISAWKWAAERAYGKPEQPVSVKGKEERRVTIRVVRE